MPLLNESFSLTPEAFELAVKGILDAAAGTLVNYESTHLEAHQASDGEYVIDITARFEALGATFLVLIECKHHKRKVERQDVQVLLAKLQSLAANKAMFFSTSGFQSGAISFADAHGIALVQLADGASSWFTKSFGPPTPPPPELGLPTYIGWWHHDSSMSVMSEEHPEYTRKALGLYQL